MLTEAKVAAAANTFGTVSAAPAVEHPSTITLRTVKPVAARHAPVNA